MGDPDTLALAAGFDGLSERLEKDDVIVHWIDAFLRVFHQAEALCQFTIGQLNHYS